MTKKSLLQVRIMNKDYNNIIKKNQEILIFSNGEISKKNLRKQVCLGKQMKMNKITIIMRKLMIKGF